MYLCIWTTKIKIKTITITITLSNNKNNKNSFSYYNSLLLCISTSGQLK